MSSRPVPDFSHVTIADRLQLVEELWDSIAVDADVEALPLSEGERALLDERLDELRANPDAGRLWSDVRADILGKHRG